MPGGDRTGPAGMGPMTGRGAGYCAGYQAPGYMNPGGGRGFGAFGRGRGWRNRFYATGLTGWQRASMGMGAWAAPPVYSAPYAGQTATREQQVDALKGQAEYFEDALDGIRKQIEELESKDAKKSG